MIGYMAPIWEEPTAQSSTPCGEQLCLRQLCSQATSTFCSGGSKGGRQGRAPPPRSKFFHFHAVFGRKNKLAHPLWELPPPPKGKPLDPPLTWPLCHERQLSPSATLPQEVTSPQGLVEHPWSIRTQNAISNNLVLEPSLHLLYKVWKSARHCLFWRPVCQDREVMTP